MPSDDLLEQFRALDPAPADELARSLVPAELDALRERALRLADASSELAGSRSAGSRRSRRSFFMPVAAVAAVAAVAVAIVLVGVGSPGGGGEGPAFASAAVRVAEVNSRLLVSEPGWSVSGADQFTPDTGEIDFSDGTHQLEIAWRPARSYDSYRRDRAEAGPGVPISVLGQEGTMIRYEDSTDFATMLPPQGATFVEIRGDLGSEGAYREILGSLQEADVETWLAAMPSSVVKPTDRSQVVDEMLRGVPLPPGLDLDRLRNEDAILSHYQLGAAVTSAVSCGWIDRWVAARSSGDTAAADESVRAMSSSRSWPILKQMQDQGAWSQNVWQYAAELARGDLDLGVDGVEIIDGQAYEYGPPYAASFGCESEFRRPTSG